MDGISFFLLQYLIKEVFRLVGLSLTAVVVGNSPFTLTARLSLQGDNRSLYLINQKNEESKRVFFCKKNTKKINHYIAWVSKNIKIVNQSF